MLATPARASIGEPLPGLRVAGSRDGYFTDDEAAEVAADIRRSGADMLFLGMVSPKKEIFLGTLRGSTWACRCCMASAARSTSSPA